MMTTPAASLRAAMALIEDESRWCRFHLAETSDGRSRDPSDADATKFCADGALCRATRYHSNGKLYRQCAHALQDAGLALFERGSYVTINDELGHAAVMACYREAIRRAGDGHAK